jgi:hypothetical protein
VARRRSSWHSQARRMVHARKHECPDSMQTGSLDGQHHHQQGERRATWENLTMSVWTLRGKLPQHSRLMLTKPCMKQGPSFEFIGMHNFKTAQHDYRCLAKYWKEHSLHKRSWDGAQWNLSKKNTKLSQHPPPCLQARSACVELPS